MENHTYRQIIGNSDAPYIQYLAKGGALFTNSYAVTHPSQPNYLALFSGSTHRVTDNDVHDLDGPTLAGELRRAQRSFVGYRDRGSPRKHNPWESFAGSDDVGVDFDDFPDNLDELPAVSFVIPNLDHDMHDGSIERADDWLKDNLGDYVAWCKTHSSLLILTFDEDDDRSSNRIATIFYGAQIVPGKYDQHIDHYSVLRTIEEMYDLPLLGNSAKAQPIEGIWKKT